MGRICACPPLAYPPDVCVAWGDAAVVDGGRPTERRGLTEGSAQDPRIGTQFHGRYTIESRLGEGGMGVVYLARQEGLGRQVVLKVLLDKFANDAIAVARFESEAHAVSRINQPNIVTVYEFGRTDTGAVFLAMEYCPGDTLLSRLRQGPLPAGEAQEIAGQIAKALQAAHDAGVIHRDLKPENIMLTQSPTEGLVVKVLDFGLAKMVEADHSQGLTEEDVIMGTPGYMSPEQIGGLQLTPCSDVYALGVIWWEMLTGRPMFTADSHIQVLVMHTRDPCPPLSQVVPGKVDAATESLILNMCQKQPQARPENGGAVVELIAKLHHAAAQTSTRLDDVDDFFSGQMPMAPPPGAPSTAPTPASPSLAQLADDAGESNPFAPPPPAPTATPSPPDPTGGPPAGNDYMAMMADVGGDDFVPGGTPFSLDDNPDDPPPAPGTPSQPPQPANAQPAGLLWQVVAHGRITNDVPLVELRRMIQQGRLSASDEAGPMGQPLKQLHEYAAFKALLDTLRAQQIERAQQQAKPGRRGGGSGGRRRRGPVIAAVVGLAVVGTVGGLFVFDRPLFDSLVDDVTRLTVDVVDDVKSQVEKQDRTHLQPWIEQWEKVHKTVPDTVVQLLERVDQKLQDPTPDRRDEVRVLLEQALVKAPTHLTATALYVHNAALSTDVDRPNALRAEDVVEELEERAQEQSDVLAAKAAVLLARHRWQDALVAAQQAERAASNKPQQVRAAKMLAAASLELRKLNAAHKAIGRAQKLAAKDTEVALLRGRVAFARADLVAANKAIDTRLRRVKDDAHAVRLAAWVTREQVSPSTAARKLQSYLKSHDDDDETRLLAARLFADAGDSRNAQKVLAAAPDKDAGKQSVGKLHADVLATRADQVLVQGDVAKARKFVLRALQGGTKSALAHRVLGRIYDVTGDTAKAKVAFESAAALAPSVRFAADAKAESAYAMLMSGAPAETVRLAEDALALDKGHLLAHQLRLTGLLAAGELAVGHKALRDLLDVNARQQRDSTALAALPPLKHQSKRLLETLQDLDVPTPQAPLKNLVVGVVRFHSDKPKKSARPLAKAVRKERDLALPMLLLAHLDVDKGSKAKAITKLQKLIAQFDAPKQAQLLLAQLEIKKGKLDVAAQRLDSVASSGSHRAQLLTLRGQLLKAQKKPDEAQQSFIKALAADPTYLPARKALR